MISDGNCDGQNVATKRISEKDKSRVQRRQMLSEQTRVGILTKAREVKKTQLSLQLPKTISFRNSKKIILKQNNIRKMKQVKTLLMKMIERRLINITIRDVEVLAVNNKKELLKRYEMYLSKRSLHVFCNSIKRLCENRYKYDNIEQQKLNKKAKQVITREELREKYINAVKNENIDNTNTFRDELLSVPLKPSYDNINDRRLAALLSKQTSPKRNIKQYAPLDALTVIQNLKLKASIDNEVAQNRVADWAVKVGVEAKILKTRETEGNQHSPGTLWDWRGRIEHNTIECQPYEKYVNYLHGKISSFWIEKQQNKSSP
jgi:hypothetical protein